MASRGREIDEPRTGYWLPGNDDLWTLSRKIWEQSQSISGDSHFHLRWVWSACFKVWVCAPSPRQSRRDAQQQTLCMRLNIPTGRPGCTCLWLHRKTGGILPSIGITSQRPKCRRDEQGHQLNLPRPRNQCPSRLVKDGCQGSGVVMSSRRRACSSNSLDEQSLQLGQKTVVPTPCAIVLRHTQH